MNLRLLAPAALLLLSAASCSEDFDVVAPYKPVTVVYGVLDAGQPVNYIRIQKAFADPNASALNVAKLPDSSYFANLTVTLQAIGGGTPETLQRVNLATEGYAKETGTFFTTPSYAYKVTTALNPASRYRLLIRNNETGGTDTAETNLIDARGLSIYELDTASNREQKFELVPYSTVPNQDRAFNWRILSGVPANTRSMETILRFRYVDQDASGKQTPRNFDYRFATVMRTGTGGWSASFPGVLRNDVFTAIGNGMGTAPAGVTRLIDSVDYIAYLGNDELYTYQQNQEALGGLTADQIQYRYTNIRGNNVIGILGSRAMKIRRQVPISDTTLAAFRNNPITKAANITGRTLD